MQNSLIISQNYVKHIEKSSSSQTRAGARKPKRGQYWLIGGGIITLPLVISWSLLQWIVKQNWTMLPV